MRKNFNIIHNSLYIGILTLILTACNNNEPQNRLIGIWSEPEGVGSFIQILDFQENGTLIYRLWPDTTWPIIFYGYMSATLQYSSNENTLVVSNKGEGRAFSYQTAYSINGDTLTIDSFSYYGKEFEPLKLIKQ